MMVVARIPESGNEPLEIVFRGNGTEVRTLIIKTNPERITLLHLKAHMHV